MLNHLRRTEISLSLVRFVKKKIVTGAAQCSRLPSKYKARVQSPAHTKTMLSSSNDSDVYMRVGTAEKLTQQDGNL